MSDNDKMESRRLDRRSAGPFVAPILGVVALLFVAVTASAATHSQSTASTFGPRIGDLVAFDTSRAPHVAKAKLTTSGVVAAYAHLPLAFVRGGGPLVGSAGMSAAGPRYGFTFSRHQAMLTLARPDRGLALALRFLSSSASVPIGARQLPGKVSYLRGSDPRRWRTGLTTYGEVVYRNLWPGVDLTFRGTAGKLEYNFLVRPGAATSAIRLAYRGARALSVDEKGNLHVRTAIASLLDRRPVSYQIVAGTRTPVASRFALHGGTSFGFVLGRYDRHRPLVIDPGLLYSTYLGGSGAEQPFGIAVDGTGSAYVTGYTQSADFPTTVGAFQTAFGGGGPDAFVTKLNAAGTTALYSTYLGGSGFDRGAAVVVDAVGNAYVTGSTQSANFPTTAGAFQTVYRGTATAFVTKLNAGGNTLLYSTYLGGGGGDQALGIAVDAGGDAFVTGNTNSTDFPTTPGAPDTTPTVGGDAFATKLNPAGSALLYSTLLGGSDIDIGRAIAVDGTGDAYVTGDTLSSNFPTTAGAFQTTYGGGQDAFVTKLNASGTAPLLYSTFLGGAGADQGLGTAIDGPGNAYVTGVTGSSNFPTTAGAFQTTYGGGQDAFVTKLNASGTAPLLYSTFLGGASTDQAFGIAVDSGGNALITGVTGSSNFPTTTTAYDTTSNGSFDAFMTKLKAAGDALIYSSYLGASGFDVADAIAIDTAGNFAYLAGVTNSTAFPTSPGAFQTSYHGGGQDGFVTKLAAFGPPASLALTPNTATNTVDDTHCVTATVHDALGNPVPGVTVRFSVSQAVATQATPSSGSSNTDANGQAQFCYTARLPGQNVIHAYADTNGNATQDTGEPSADANKTWTLPPSTDCNVSLGGSIVTAGGDPATFGGQAGLKGTRVQGSQQYEDKGPAQPRKVQSIEQTAISCSADRTSASIFGTARINGSGTFVFRIDVTDAGQPGTSDTYGIRLSDGYFSGQQPVSGGNIQIR